MGLKDLRLPEQSVTFPGGVITVRGLSLDDIIALTRVYAPAMSELFKKFADEHKKTKKKGLPDFNVLGSEVLQAAPDLAATIIALGAGEPDAEAVAVARRLPAAVQLECLEAIGILTVAVEGGLKKVVETVIRVARSATGALTSLQQPLPNG